MIMESIRMSWSNIVHNKMRSFLTILGIIIGVASIIALITIVKGATQEITNQIAALGADKITVQITGTVLKNGLSESDFAALGEVENISGVSPTISSITEVAANGETKDKVTVQGKNQNYFKEDTDLLASGRAINATDVAQSTYVALIGTEIANDLYPNENPIGRQILINGSTFTVIGTLQDSGQFALSSVNDAVIMPYTTAMKVLGVHYITSVDIYMADSSKADEIVDDVNVVLNQAFNYKDNAFSVFNMQDMLNAITQVTDIMSLVLGGIASISLIVGGIGIMNMMLVSVTERTSEIGLRKALGAIPSRIRMQFIIESIFLSLIGGFVGLLLGILIAFIASVLIGIAFTLSISTVFLAVGFSAMIGIIFGYMPARKASRLNPIDALRHI
ncbi:MAG: ABC transporter permease [Anaerofustis sp.]